MYPTQGKIPTISIADDTIVAAKEAQRKSDHVQVLQYLTTIVQNEPPSRMSTSAGPRMDGVTTTFTNLTSPRVVKNTRYFHEQRTRANTSMPGIDEDQDDSAPAPTLNKHTTIQRRIRKSPH